MSLTSSSASSTRAEGVPATTYTQRRQTPAPADSFGARWKEQMDGDGDLDSLQGQTSPSAEDAPSTSPVADEGRPPVIKIPLVGQGDTQQAGQDSSTPAQQAEPTEKVAQHPLRSAASAKPDHAKGKEASDPQTSTTAKSADGTPAAQPLALASTQPAIALAASDVAGVLPQGKPADPVEQIVAPSAGKKVAGSKVDNQAKAPATQASRSGDDKDSDMASPVAGSAVSKLEEGLPAPQITSVQSGQNPTLTLADHVIPASATPTALQQHEADPVSQEIIRSSAHDTGSTVEFRAAEPALLAASPGSLEFGVQSGTLGWVRVRAELDKHTGSVSAVMLAPSAQTAASLDLQLPAMQAYLSGEQVSLTSLTVTAQSSSEQSGLPANMQGQERQGRSQHSDGSPDSQASAEAFSGGDSNTFISQAYTGGWLNVLA